MSEVLIVVYGLLSFLLLPWALTNAKTDGEGITIIKSVSLVSGLIIKLALSFVLLFFVLIFQNSDKKDAL